MARGEPLLAARIGSRCAQLLQGNMAARSTATGDPEAALATHFGDTELLALWQMGLRNQAAQRALEQLTQRAELATAGIFSEAKQTAQEQHTQQPQLPLQYWKHPASALPYAVLAAQALDTSQTEYALELALQPIVFARQGKAQQLPHLAAAYAQAIAAATARDDAAYEETLQQEALERSVNIAAHALRGSSAQQP